MQRGGKFIGTAAMLSVAACGGEQGKLQVRTIGAPVAAVAKPVPLRIAEARGHLALGNVALALEAFRKAAREDPNSIDALTGVAACYDKMARFDLSRRHYEAALAIAPGNPHLLAAFAGSLDLQGRKTEAASVRLEIQQRLAMTAEKSVPQPAPAPALRPPAIAEAAVPRPTPAAPANAVQPLPSKAFAERRVAPPPIRQVAAKPVRAAEAAPLPIQNAAAKPAPAAKAVPAPTPAPRSIIMAATPRSVTVALPPARPASPAVPPKPPVETAAAPALAPARPMPPPPPKVAVQIAAVAVPMPARRVPVPAPAAPAAEAKASIARPQAAPVAAAPAPPAAPSPNIARAEPAKPSQKIARAEPAAAPVTFETTGPRLERTSLREVALITTAAPQWRALTVKRTQRSATVRFVPLRQASINLSNIRLLNAARVNRLAARTRSYLVGRGWSPMAIGDAPAVRARSVIFYPPERRRTAQTLSAQFGFVMQARPGSRQITVLLGRDAARVSALRASG